jgi:ADP-heptose:LPS heptosyltransferase
MLLPWAQGPTLKIKLRKGVPVLDAELLPIPLAPALQQSREAIVLHCRGIEKCPERNLMEARWDAIVKDLNDNGVVPLIVGAGWDYSPDGDVQDCRQEPLSAVIMWMRNARVVVGASSGPMHLAQACEAPVVVWSGNAAKDKPRYKEVWNHFDSPTTFVSSTWQPGVSKILKAIESYA